MVGITNLIVRSNVIRCQRAGARSINDSNRKSDLPLVRRGLSKYYRHSTCLVGLTCVSSYYVISASINRFRAHLADFSTYRNYGCDMRNNSDKIQGREGFPGMSSMNLSVDFGAYTADGPVPQTSGLGPTTVFYDVHGRAVQDNIFLVSPSSYAPSSSHFSKRSASPPKGS